MWRKNLLWAPICKKQGKECLRWNKKEKKTVRTWPSVGVQDSTVKTVNPSNNRNNKLILGYYWKMSKCFWNMQRNRLNYPKRNSSQVRLSNKDIMEALFRRWQTTHNRRLDVAWDTHRVKPVKHYKSTGKNILLKKKAFLHLLVINLLFPKGFGAIKTLIFINMTTFIHNML